MSRQENRLQHAYSFWHSSRASGKPTPAQPYDQQLQQITSFETVEGFWRAYSHMIRPSDLQGHYDIHLFKSGIKPMWEDEANSSGGKWIVRLRKGLASRCWENLILAILGEQFMVNDEICGAVVSVRYQEDIISVWNRTASDQTATTRIRDTLKRVLNLPPNTILEYKVHADSLRYSGANSFQTYKTLSEDPVSMKLSKNAFRLDDCKTCSRILVGLTTFWRIILTPMTSTFLIDI